MVTYIIEVMMPLSHNRYGFRFRGTFWQAQRWARWLAGQHKCRVRVTIARFF